MKPRTTLLALYISDPVAGTCRSTNIVDLGKGTSVNRPHRSRQLRSEYQDILKINNDIYPSHPPSQDTLMTQTTTNYEEMSPDTT